MKIERDVVPVRELHSLGKALSSWAGFRDHFKNATGLEVDIIQALVDRWETVAGRIINPVCKKLIDDKRGCECCAEAFAQQIHLADEAGIGAFTTCCCFAGQKFSVTLLTDSPDPKLYLLIGRVPIGSISEKRYEGALKLASIMLPQVRLDWEKSNLHSALGMTATLRKACCYVHNHYHERCNLADTAEYCGVSKDWLSRHFKKGTGHSLPEYIRQHRLQTAAELLSVSKHTITEICFESGFQSISQFNRLFYLQHTMSPSEFRNNASLR